MTVVHSKTHHRELTYHHQSTPRPVAHVPRVIRRSEMHCPPQFEGGDSVLSTRVDVCVNYEATVIIVSERLPPTTSSSTPPAASNNGEPENTQHLTSKTQYVTVWLHRSGLKTHHQHTTDTQSKSHQGSSLTTSNPRPEQRHMAPSYRWCTGRMDVTQALHWHIVVGAVGGWRKGGMDQHDCCTLKNTPQGAHLPPPINASTSRARPTRD